MKNKIAILLALILTVSLFGCGKKDNNSLTKITLALDWTPNTNHTGIYVADKMGWFEEAGIDLEIIEAIESGAEAVVASPTKQFEIFYQYSLFPADSATDEEKIPVTTVAAIIQHNTSGIISPAELSIESPKDMCGHNYATWELPIEQAVIRQVVTADGGNFDEIELIPQYVENIQGAFESGINSVWIYYAWDGVNADMSGIDTNFFYFKDYDDALDYYSPVIIANDSWLASNGELAKKFMSAVSKGYEYAISNPTESATILVEANEGMDLDLCIESQKWLASQYKADAGKWGIIDAERWDAFFTWVYSNGLCEYEIPSGYGFTNEYLP